MQTIRLTFNHKFYSKYKNYIQMKDQGENTKKYKL